MNLFTMRAWVVWSGLALLLGAWPCPVAGETAQEAEYAIKAAFIQNFFQFVKWPAERQPQPDDPWVVCILGRDPFGQVWDSARRVQDHAVVVRHPPNVAAARECHVLFVAQPGSQTLGESSTRGVLTVGDTPGFAQTGGMINFFIWRDRVRFEINAEAARQAGLTLSSKLLGLARLVTGGEAP